MCDPSDSLFQSNSPTPSGAGRRNGASATTSSYNDTTRNESLYREMLENHNDDLEDVSDYENSPAIAEPVREVMRKTGIRDAILAGEALEENAFCVEAAVDFILHLGSLGVDQEKGKIAASISSLRILARPVSADLRTALIFLQA